MLMRTAKSCGPDAPTLASSSRSCVGPTGLGQNLIRRRRWQKSPVTGESSTYAVKTIACGNAGRFGSRARSRLLTRSHCERSDPYSVIPGWSEGPDLRCAIAHRGISRFRVRCFASPRNDGYGFTRCLKIESIASIEYERPTLAAVITREGG